MSAEAHVAVHAIYPILLLNSKVNLRVPKNCNKFHENPSSN